MQHHSTFHTAANSTTPVTEGEKILLKKKIHHHTNESSQKCLCRTLESSPPFLITAHGSADPLMLSALQPCSKAIYNP